MTGWWCPALTSAATRCRPFHHRREVCTTLRVTADPSVSDSAVTPVRGAGGPRTARALTVESLREHREVFRSLAANLPRCSLHVFDRDLRFVFAAGPALEEDGFDPATIEGRTLSETVPPEFSELLTGHYRRALTGEHVDFDHISSQGRTFHTRVRPVHDNSGQVIAGLLVSEDVTAARNLVEELADTASRLRDAQRLAGLGVLVYDVETERFTFSDELTDAWGLPRGAVDAAVMIDLLHPDDAAQVRRAWRDVLVGTARASLEYRILRAGDGDVRHLRTELAREEHPDGGLAAVRGTQIDVTDLVRARLDLAYAQSLADAVFAVSPDTTLVADLDGGTVLWSSGGRRGLLGRTAEQLIGMGGSTWPIHPADVTGLLAVQEAARDAPTGDTLSLSYRMQDPAGDWRWLSCRITPFRRGPDGRAVEVVCVVRDVHDVVESQQQLAYAAHHDALTGLPNRTSLLQALAARFEADDAWGAAVLYLDLDHFKRVNDQFGHPAGDAVLRVLAHRLQSVLREVDLIARVGGDEFVVLLGPPAPGWEVGRGRGTSERDARSLADRLRAVACEPVEHEGRSHVLCVSIGIRVASPGLSAQDALRDADVAMNRAKRDGRDAVVLFDQEQRAGARHDATAEQLLRQALALDGLGDALSVAYQPVFDLSTGRLRSFEALARLQGVDGEPLAAQDFIAVAEQTGLIKRLGEAVLEQACDDLASWRQRCPSARGLQMAVNLSARQAQDPGLVDMVLCLLQTAGLAPADLVLELTETVLLSAGLPALTALRRLRTAGVGIAIDDFGVGYASLRYLATLPVTGLKVDRSFTSGLPHDATCSTIVRAIAGLAADMDLTCVVEGVETEAQLQALPAGVHAQGLLLGEPLPARATLALLLTRAGD